MNAMPDFRSSEGAGLSLQDFEVPAVEMSWLFRHRAFVLIYCLVTTFLILVRHSNLENGGLQAIAVMALGVGVLYLTPRYRARRLLRQHAPDGGPTTYSVGDVDVRVATAQSVLSLAYGSIRKAQEGTTSFILHGRTVGPIVVPKRLFPAQALEYLRARVRTQVVLKNARITGFWRALRWFVTLFGLVFLGLLAWQIYVQRPR